MAPTRTGGDILTAALRADGVSVEQVREAMAEHVPAHMIPQHFALVDQVPYTLAGKIDRRAVASLLAASVADSAAPDRRIPATPLEFALIAIIGDVLGAHEVGVDDDFFALGGDSVRATQTVARIRSWLDTPDAIVADIFATRTVSALAALLSRRETEPGRLDQIAELYLEVVQMEAGSVVAAIAETEAAQ
jgi:mycobactin phenyloxazoline synthetase